jgi:hypothetical protein
MRFINVIITNLNCMITEIRAEGFLDVATIAAMPGRLGLGIPAPK